MNTPLDNPQNPRPQTAPPAEPPAEPEKEKKEGLSGRWLIETIVLVGLAFVLALAIRSYLIEPYRIPSGSMLPTIQLQDQVLANKLVFKVGGQPKYKDIVVFYDPTGDYENLIKRVIAVEGQTVDFTDSGQLVIDGTPLDEPYTHGQPSFPLSPDQRALDAAIEYPFTVPDGMIWAMGDNRTRSSDSRAFGPVPVDQITGRAFLTYWPLAHFAPLR